jgi:Tol biopolymer transport system component
MGPNGENARPVISAAGGWNSDFCWAKGGKWFVVSYVVGTSDAAGTLFAFREPVAPNSTFADAKLLAKDDFVRWTGPASDGGKLYAIGELLRKEAVVWDSKTGALSTYMQGVPANEIAYSPDGLWVAYTDAADDSLWKMRVDGSASFRLTPAGMKAYGAHWSPQGKQIAFMGSLSNQQYLAYTIPVAGGAVSPIHRDSLAQGIPSWSPDGRFVVYGERTLEKAPARMRIHMVDTRTGRETEIPGSAGKWTARWSPDGRFIAAQSAASDQLFLYDVASERWSELVSMPNDNLFWSSNSQSIFFASRDATTMTVYRVNVRDRRINHVVDFPRESNMEPILAGVTPDDKEILHRKVISSDVYELNVQWP